MQPKQTPKITVIIRKRPLNRKQLQKCENDIIRVEKPGTVITSECKQKVDLTKYIEQTTFNFDSAFDQHSTNEQIYATCIQPLIDSAFMGAKVSCFAYGQTGSGKTFTMKGDLEKGITGLYYLGAREIFRYLQQSQFQGLEVSVSFFQIYCGKLFDLLNNRSELKIREDKKSNINVIGIEEKSIHSAEEFLELIEYGSNFRVTSQNATNNDSSRSHAILQICLKDGRKTFSKISFIDLAGNERGADHMDQSKQTKIDGAEINKSLLALKECIRALDQGKSHTPFRGSKLTMVLKDSFLGFCKTVMIGNVSPNVSSAENTMNTLRYADRVKELKNSGDSVPLTRQEQQARELMLPRANQNSLKMAISKDDEDSIDIKKDIARKNHNKRPEFNNDMDIEAHIPERRKTDAYQPRSFDKSYRRSLAVAQDENNPREKHANFQIKCFKDHKTQNVPKPIILSQIEKIDNGNVHENIHCLPKLYPPAPDFQKVQLDYGHLMQEIEREKQSFIEQHMKVIKEEGTLLREEGIALGKTIKYSDIDIKAYSSDVRKNITRKMNLLTGLQRRIDSIEHKLIDSQQMEAMLVDTQMHDEQLLEDLPTDGFGGKLF